MGVVILCDGCERPEAGETLAEVGRVQPVLYCQDCLAIWQGFEAEADRVRARLAGLFESWRAEATTKIRSVSLKALPDE